MRIQSILCSLCLVSLSFLTACSQKPQNTEAQIELELNEYKQEFFDAIHPIGTANRIKLNSMVNNPPFLDLRITIYWEGPITKDGYTKMAFRIDTEVDRITSVEVEDTNGITNNDLGYAAGFILSSILSGE